MKLLAAIILCLLILAGCSSQADREMYRQFPPYEKKGEYYVKAEYMPDPVGGIDQLVSLVRYPVLNQDVNGRVYVKAYINEYGTVDSALVLKGVQADCDREAVLAVLRAKFIPASISGQNVKAIVSVPFVFKIKKYIQEE